MSYLKRTLISLFLLLGPCFSALAEQTLEPLWLDVRTIEEFQADHVAGALVLPHTHINADSTAIFNDKDQTIYVYCRSGKRAGAAKKALEELGFSNVINAGGLDAAKALHQVNNQN